MTVKKRGIDSRQDPASGVSKANRVDRVFIPSPGTVAPRPTPRDAAAQIANELLATPRAPTNDSLDTDLALHRQLADLQQRLASKDDELAAEVEKRLQTVRELEQYVESHRMMQAKPDELAAYEARTAGIEQRLLEQIAAADELVQINERERAATAAALARVEEINVAFEATRALWNAERTILEERMASDVADLDAQRKAAIDASADALDAQAAHLRETHEAELVDLRATYEQSLATLRGELEPHAVQAHSLAEERERLIAELASVRNEAIRDTVEREQDYQRELAQALDDKDSELAALARTHAVELGRANAERDEQLIALREAGRSAEAQRLASEEQADALRQTLKAVQREVAELGERVAALEIEKRVVEDALERSRREIETLLEDKRQQADTLEATSAELRLYTIERRKLVAHLEEALALFGALPPKPD